MTHCIPNTWGVWYAPVIAWIIDAPTQMYVSCSRSESFSSPSSYRKKDAMEQTISVPPEKRCV